MAVKDTLEKPLQESLLTLLAYNDEHGGMVAKLLDPMHFEGDYSDIARRCINYHLKYKRAPGIHIDDLFGDLLTPRDDNKHITYRHVLTNLLKVRDVGVDIHYLLDEVREFTRLQHTRQVLLDASQRIASRQQHALDEVDKILEDLLRARRGDTSIGMKLVEIDRLFDFMQHRKSEFRTGIEQLDKADICPAKGTATLVLGSSGVGKSWFLIHLGRVALICRQKVLHVTLEMSEEQVSQRYLQSLFNIGRRDTKTLMTRITPDLSSNKKLPEPTFELNAPMDGEFTFFNGRDDDFTYAREELQTRFQLMGRKIENLIIKRWSPSSLTPRALSAHLDLLEIAEGFKPDMVIVDYLGIMKISTSYEKEYRHALGQTLVDLRGIAVDRNIAMVVAQQVSREGAKANVAEDIHVAEDWSLVGTSDCILTISATKAEKALGLCRLFVSKARDEKDKFSVLLTQNYALGQFVVDSMLMHPRYQELLKDVIKRETDQSTAEDQSA